jgi:hypothetical protein
MVHKNQKFTLIDPIKVSIDNKKGIKSCALMSESECIVFTRGNATLVSLIDHTQKQLSYPFSQEAAEHLWNLMSFNVMMHGTPCLIITTGYYEKQIQSKMEKLYPA